MTDLDVADTTADPRTAPDRLRALFTEFDCINPDDLYDALVADPQMLMDVLRVRGFVKRQWVQCLACGAEAKTRGQIIHGPHYQAVTFARRWGGGEFR